MKSKYQRSFAIGIVGCLGLLALAWSFSCGYNNGIEYKSSKPDTVQTWIKFVTPLDWVKWNIGGNQAYDVQAWRLTKDTFAFDSADANTMRKIWKRDTVFAIEVRIPSKDTTHGKRDSIIYPLLSPKYILQDYNKNPNKP